MQKRVFLSPLQPSSRAPEKVRAAVRTVLDERDTEREKDEAAKLLTPWSPRARLRTVETRVLCPPVTRSVHRDAIRAAVEMAAMREALGRGFGTTSEFGP